MSPRSVLRTFVLPAALACTGAFAGGVSFEHKDWQLACDNTRTCRAAGYQADDADMPVSVLLTRKAGPAQAVSGQVQLGIAVDSKPPAAVQVTVAGRPLGRVVIDRDTAIGGLDAAQVAALVSALAGTGSIDFSAGSDRWRLSGAGATAVLVKMDEFQGRIGTTGALVRKGSASEAGVPAAVAPPVVQAVAVPGTEVRDAALAARIRRALPPAGEDCAEQHETPEPPTLWRLAPGKVLLSLRCWRAAYNEGYGYWVAEDKPPHRPVLVTTEATGFDAPHGRILSAQKDRGMGDCWRAKEWTWNGAHFVPTGEFTTGMCKSLAPEAWQLPTLVTGVRPPQAKQSEEQRK